LALRSPPRLSRCRVVLPEEASIGLTPQRAANAAALVSRCGSSPAAISRYQQRGGRVRADAKAFEQFGPSGLRRAPFVERRVGR